MSLDSTVRIGDAEREDMAAALGQHLSLGHLTMHEFESRLDTVYTASTRGELDAARADLPTTAPQPPLHQPPARWPRAGTPWVPREWMLWAPWAVTGMICLVIWVATSLAQGHPLSFWPIWVVGPWGLMLLARTALGHARPSAGRS
jgi:hypothetical protein